MFDFMSFGRRYFPIRHSKPDPAFVAGQLRKPSGEFSHKIAGKMDQVNAPLFDLTLEIMKPVDHESILEIGFGSGSFMPKLLAAADRLKISGVDYSPEMVEKATAGNREAVESGILDLKQGNSNELPFPDNSFDKVFCNMVIYFWDRPTEHLTEVRRVLKAGGRFYSGFRSRESMQVFPFIEHGFNMYGEDEWSDLLNENGFNVAGLHKRRDPAIEEDDRTLQLESVCMVAEAMRG